MTKGKRDPSLKIDLIAFVSNIYATTHCICSLRGLMEDFKIDLECTNCRARKLLERVKVQR